MLQFLRAFTRSLVIIGFNACAATKALHEVMTDAKQKHESQSLPPGKLFSGPVLNITAPNSEGWRLLTSDPSGMVFARRGSTPDESFAAQVVMFDPPQTDYPEEFEALIVKGARAEAETGRFRTIRFTHQFTSARGYPCAQMNNISEDTQARSGPDTTETLIMQNEHLYCRHPVQKKIGFAITYSHRGKELLPGFRTEAHSFIDGIQVPDSPPSQ